MCVDDSSVWSLDWSSTHEPRTSWKFGLPFSTGTIQFEKIVAHVILSEFSQDSAHMEGTVARSLPLIRVKTILPQWLSYKAFDIVAWKAQVGWKQCLRVRNVFPASEDVHGEMTPFCRARRGMFSGSLKQLRLQLENRELTLFDEDSNGRNLLSVSAIWSDSVSS